MVEGDLTKYCPSLLNIAWRLCASNDVFISPLNDCHIRYKRRRQLEMPQFFTKKTRLGLQVITPAAVATMYIPTYTRMSGLPCHLGAARFVSLFHCGHLVNLCAPRGWWQQQGGARKHRSLSVVRSPSRRSSYP